MQNEVRIIEGNISLPYRWSMGPVITRFFQGFQDKKILGTNCTKCSRVLVPARKFCPRCYIELGEETWLEVANTGLIRSWVLINFAYEGQPKKPPYLLGVIELEGADVGFTHFLGGVDVNNVEELEREIKIGRKVEAVWKDQREGNIFDIEYFQPV